MSGWRSVVIEADGGSRGNPGPSAYGAVLRDAETGEVIAEDCATIGVATNNVAEYSGLIAGLRLAGKLAPGAAIEVRMDSRLVVEQMSGRWKVKHPSMVPLAAEAKRLAPSETTFTWVPRERNEHADRLANEALDGKRSGVSTVSGPPNDPVSDPASDPMNDPVWHEAPESLIEELEEPEEEAPEKVGRRGWTKGGGAPPTTLILVRHGVTPHTVEKRFSGGLASANPGLSDEGRAQVRATAEWLAQIAGSVDAVVASPVRRTAESAEIVAEVLGLPVEAEPGFAEMEFGSWDGMTFTEVAEKYQADLDSWLGSLEVSAGGGESFREVEARVLDALQRLLTTHQGRTVVVVSHVTPIKTLVAHAVNAPLESVYRMELAPASVTVLSFFRGGPAGDQPMASMRLFNARPTGTPPL